MVKPDDDFDDDFDDVTDTVTDDATDMMEARPVKVDLKHHETRRKIEDILEARRLREEFGELGL